MIAEQQGLFTPVTPVVAQPGASEGGVTGDFLSSIKALGHSVPSRAEKIALDGWQSEQADWLHWYVCREFIREHYSQLGEQVLLRSCGSVAYAYKHEETGEKCLRPSSCGHRDLCPACAITYGVERGLSVLSLFETALVPGYLVPELPAILSFGHVFTFPPWVTSYLDECVTFKRLYELRKALSQLTKAISSTLDFWYGQVGVGASINWHWWHSDKPLAGPHWHAHVDVPNASPKGPLRLFGKVSGDDLRAMKRFFASCVAELPFVVALGYEVPAELVVHYRFIMKPKQLRHRLRYDYRHPLQDFCKFAKNEGLPAIKDEQVYWFLNACEALQRVQLVRHVGWLCNSKRVKLGLECEKPENDVWKRDYSCFYRFERFDDTGVWLTRHASDGYQSKEFWKRDLVRLVPSSRPRRYHWAGASP